MNTSCKYQPVAYGSPTQPCGHATSKGRTHCELHRAEHLRRLASDKLMAKKAWERAEDVFLAYLSEGYGP